MLSSILSTALLASAVSAAPFSADLPNGFPNIKVPSPALTKIEVQAHGTLPNTPLAKSLSATDITNWQVVAFNELFEVAFYTSLIANITGGVSGYSLPAAEKKYALEAIVAIQAQEELHALGANAILETAGGTPIQPCEYVFPPAVSYTTAIDFARTFTDVVVSTLQDVAYEHAITGDPEYIPLIGSVIGQESEQIGFFRETLGLIPSELPFLTRSSGVFAFSILNQLVVVPGSCPNANVIDVPILGALTVVNSEPAPKTQTLAFEFTASGPHGYNGDFYLVYVNQQNLPVVEKPKNVKVSGSTVYFEALFPYTEYVMNGLTLAAVTTSAGPFADVDDVASAAVYGPGLIEVQ